MTVAVVTMEHLVEVEFKGNRRAFYKWSGETPPPLKAAVIVQVERGEDLGRVHSTGELADRRKEGTPHGKASPTELPAIIRIATPKEIDTAVRLRADEHSVRKAAIEMAREMKLDMKVSDTEWQWDRRRLTCYFTADQRVDFRQLVRQLERRFSTRVHMWHIGVRDEARRLDGVGRCGRQFCSSSWLPELRPVKSSSAKDQRLSTLNPSQISGTCGRLMCCLRHEHEFYVQARKRFPKEGKVVTTAVGEERIIANDIFRDQVTLRSEAGEERIIPLAQLRKEMGEGVQFAVDYDSNADDDSSDDSSFVTLARAGESEVAIAEDDLDETDSNEVLLRDETPGVEDGDDCDSDTDDEADNDASDSSAGEVLADAGSSDNSDHGTQSSAGRKKRSRRRRGRRGGRRNPNQQSDN